MWAFAAAAVIALLAGLAARAAGARRRVVHEELVREAVARMCTPRADAPPGLRERHRGLVGILTRQEDAARLLDRARRPGPATPEFLAALAGAERMLTDEEDAAVLAAAVELVPRRTAREEDPAELPDDGTAPSVFAYPELWPLCAAMASTAERQRAMARAVLAQAARLDEPTAACRERLAAELDRAAAQVRAGRAHLAAGRLPEALGELARLDPPIPLEGVPGQAAVPELRHQARGLARLALRHREALARWCAAASGRRIRTIDEVEA